jgi:hypothetical protein
MAFADPGETIRVNLSLDNYTVNKLERRQGERRACILSTDTRA